MGACHMSAADDRYNRSEKGRARWRRWYRKRYWNDEEFRQREIARASERSWLNRTWGVNRPTQFHKHSREFSLGGFDRIKSRMNSRVVVRFKRRAFLREFVLT
jgi:hypothetical protein